MGQYQSRLKSLADDQLLSGLAGIVLRRNQITAEFLAYLAEMDERQLFLELGFYPVGYHEACSSLFEYCVEALGLCESTAGRHIAAARVCRNHPEVFDMVASGALHASALSLLKKHVTLENAKELFELCTHRSARRVEALLSTRFPRPDVCDLVRRLPARAVVTPDVGCSMAQTSMADPSRNPTAERVLIVTPLCESSVRPGEESGSCELSVVPQVAEASRPRRIEPLSADRYGVHFTADGGFCALLERVRGLAGHRLPSGDLMTLLKRGLEAYERELEKERFAVHGKTRRSREVAPRSGALSAPALAATDSPQPALDPNPSPGPNRKRRYPAAVVRAVFLRDGKQCSYISPDGRQCGARRCLELDHIEPRALGGDDTIENLRLRCRAHNQWYARRYFGTSRVRAAIQESRRRRARRG